jgi:hypothetical protein
MRLMPKDLRILSLYSPDARTVLRIKIDISIAKLSPLIPYNLVVSARWSCMVQLLLCLSTAL